MERHFLKILLISILIVSCQQVEVYQENPSEFNNVDKGIEATVAEISPVPPYQDIWEYIKKNNSSQNNNILNDQVLSYMNMHLKDIDKFNEYLNDSVSYTHLTLPTRLSV